MKSSWPSINRYIAQEAQTIIVLIAISLLSVGLEALIPWPMKLVLDQVLAGQELPDQVKWIHILPGSLEATGLLTWLIFFTLALFLLSKITYVAKSTLQSRLGARMQYQLAADMLSHIQALTIDYHSRISKGDLVRRISEDSKCVSDLAVSAFLPAVNSVVMLMVIYTVMWKISSTIALVAIGASVPLGFLMKILAPRMMQRSYSEQQSQGELWSVSERTLTALPMVQAFGGEAHEVKRFRAVTSITVTRGLASLVLQILFTLGVNGITTLASSAILVIGGFQAHRGTISLGTLFVLLTYVNLLYDPLVQLTYVAPVVSKASGSARRAKEVLGSEEYLPERADALHLGHGERRIQGRISFRNVSFSYKSGTDVLHNIDLEIQPGETVAIVGPTGAGKSTLISLVSRLLDPTEGQVLIDGIDIREAKISSVRAQVSILMQESVLLPTTIANNIAFGDKERKLDEIIWASRMAGADEFINRLPKGYHTMVGEVGSTLSGGQKQRIAIARAVLKDSPILILDEPTSALDPESEDWVMNTLGHIGLRKTTLIIAHRLSTIRRADRIVVMDQGKIAETGTHEELLRANGLYKQLYQHASAKNDNSSLA